MKTIKLIILALAAIVVTGNVIGANVTITKSVGTLITEKSWTISTGTTINTLATNFTLDDVISISTTGEANCGSLWYSSSIYDWRLYQNKSGNVTISAASGYELVSIKLTFTNSNSGTLSDGVNTLTSGNAVNVSGSSKTYSVANSGSATNGQIRISTFEVTYKAGCTGTQITTPSVTATPGNASATLTWTADPNATKYQVNWNNGGYVDATSPVEKTGLTNGTQYTWKVKAIGDGTTYCDSEEATGTVTPVAPPATATVTSAVGVRAVSPENTQPAPSTRTVPKSTPATSARRVKPSFFMYCSFRSPLSQSPPSRRRRSVPSAAFVRGKSDNVANGTPCVRASSSRSGRTCRFGMTTRISLCFARDATCARSKLFVVIR